MLKYILQNDLGGIFGTIITIVSISLELCVALWAFKKFDVSRWKAAIIIPARFILSIGASLLAYWMERGFRDFGGGALTRIYIYLPFLMYPIYRLLKIDWKKACDLLALHFAAFQTPVHLGCIFTSCCYGYECSFGIWNEFVKHYTFPVQIFDTITSGCIVLVLILLARRWKYKPTGRLFPLLLIFHGVDRFAWELARDVRKIWLCFTSLSFHALFMIAVGVVALWLVLRSERKNILQKPLLTR